MRTIMEKNKIASRLVHEIPDDIKSVLLSNTELQSKWNNLTPIARNEWICWVISVKMSETRKKHILRLVTEVSKGKKRPCCWPGCRHR